MPLIFFGGALMAVILVGAVAGFNLMFPAVAYEGQGCLNAISRSFNYVYSKPWHMAFIRFLLQFMVRYVICLFVSLHFYCL